MQRNSMYHSAEGTHWQKKNHKYIRIENGRYVYPSDRSTGKLNATQKRNRYNAANGKSSYVGRGWTDGNKNHYDLPQNYSKAISTYQKKTAIADRKRKEAAGSPNATVRNQEYAKKEAVQERNRAAAANGKIVNPTYTLRDKDGTKIARLSSKDKVQSPTANDLKNYSREKSNAAKRKSAAGSPNEYVRNQEHAKKMTNIMNSPSISPKYKDGIGPSSMSKQRGKLALRKQGSNSNYKELSQQHAQEQKRKAAANGGPTKHSLAPYDIHSGKWDFKDYTSDQEWAKDRTSKGSARANWTKEQLNQKKRSNAVNKQGSVDRQQESKAKNPNPSRPKVSDDFKEELEYNSKKNVYPEKVETEHIEVEKSDKDWSKKNSTKKKTNLKDRVTKAISNLKNKKKKKQIKVNPIRNNTITVKPIEIR